MGAYTLANFTAYLKHRLGGRDDLESPTDHLDRYVNTAYKRLTSTDKIWEVRKQLSFPELDVDTGINTTDGNPYVLTPTDCLYVEEVYDSTSLQQLKWISWADYVGKTDRATTTAESKPTYWHRRGTRIYLYPTPDSTYAMKVYYKKRVTSLDGSAYNTTVIGEEWDDVILEIATYIAFYELNQPDRAKVAKDNAKEMIAEKIGLYDREERARRETVRPDPSWMNRESYKGD